MKTPKDPRHQARRLALSEIYSKETSQNPYTHDKKDLQATIQQTLDIKDFDKKLYKSITNGVENNKKNLIELIQKNSPDWKVEQMYKIDISILLMATWEIIYSKTPKKVIVDEAVELAKEFGETDSSRFVNGVLSGIIN